MTDNNIFGTPRKKKKNEHNDVRLQSPLANTITSPEFMGAFMSPTPMPLPRAPDSTDWTPAITKKVPMEGFSAFPDTNTPGPIHRNGRGQDLLSPSMSDLLQYSELTTNIYEHNTEALSNRINKRRTSQQSLSSFEEHRSLMQSTGHHLNVMGGEGLLSASGSSSLFFGGDANFHGQLSRGSSIGRGGLASDPPRMGIAEIEDVSASQGSTTTDKSGIAAITAAAAQVNQDLPLSSPDGASSGSSPDDAKNAGRRVAQVKKVRKQQQRVLATATTTSSSNSSSKGGVRRTADGADESDGEEDNVSSGQRSFMSPEMKELSVSSNLLKPATCNCKKSKCLKMYCDCFRLSEYCRDGFCRCNDCNNLPQYEAQRMLARKSIQDRNPEAFKPRVKEEEKEHLTGCHCRKSACLKKYCECYTGKVACSSRCRCVDCQNTPQLYAKLQPTSNGTAATQRTQSLTAPTDASGSDKMTSPSLLKTASYPPFSNGNGRHINSLAASGAPNNNSMQTSSSGPKPVKLFDHIQQANNGSHRLDFNTDRNSHSNGSSFPGGGGISIEVPDVSQHSQISTNSLLYSDHSDESHHSYSQRSQISQHSHTNSNGRSNIYQPASSIFDHAVKRGNYSQQSVQYQRPVTASTTSSSSAYRSGEDENDNNNLTDEIMPMDDDNVEENRQEKQPQQQPINAFSPPQSPVHSTSTTANNGILSQVSSPQKLWEFAELCEEKQREMYSPGGTTILRKLADK